MHLIRPICNPQGPCHGPQVGQGHTVRDSGSAMSLNREVEGRKRCGRGSHFGCCDGSPCLLVPHLIELMGCRLDQEPRPIQLNPALGEGGGKRAVLRKRLAKHCPPGCAASDSLERSLAHPNAAHAVVKPPGAKPPLSDLKAAPLPEEDVVHRDPDVVEADLGMPVRRVVVAKHCQRSYDLHAVTGERNDGHRLLRVGRSQGVGFAHEDREPASRVHRPACPPLGSVEDVGAAVPHDGRLDVGRVRGGDPGLRHRKARADLPLEQRHEPLAALLVRPVPRKRLHVAGVRS
mmetsp:Transcript_9871/g.23568  ORF Transcript_9871/g.23568 Transcript_9871/m.23568 type:complete len:290 (-) Transcript_9871:1010-1879(-)